MRPRVISAWIRRTDRRPAAFAPGYAPIDGRSHAELLARAPRVARGVRYYDEWDSPDGDWSGLFLADPSMLLATIATCDLTSLDDRMRGLTPDVGPDATGAFVNLCDALLVCADLCWEVNAWQVACDRLAVSQRPRGDFVGALSAAIRSELGPSLRRLEALAMGAGAVVGEGVVLDLEDLHEAWGRRTGSADDTAYVGGSAAERIEAALMLVRRLFASMFAVALDLTRVAGLELDVDLLRDDHAPHVALYIASVELFQTVQRELDGLTPRFVSHYQRGVLGARPRPAQADRAVLIVTPAPGLASPPRVAAGARFAAGADGAGKPIVFAAEHDLTLSEAELIALRTSGVRRGSGVDGDDAGRLAIECLTSEITPAGLAGGWPAFGGAGDPRPDDALRPADLGFLVASPRLALGGGARRIALDLRPAAPAADDPRAALWARIAAATGLTRDAAVAAAIAGAFRFSVTTAEGWRSIQADPAPPGLASPLVFRLTATDPAVSMPVAPDPRLAGLEGGALLARLQQAVLTLDGPAGRIAVHPLALLDGLEMTTANLAVSVEGLAPQRVETPDGDVDGSSPFSPFGGLPRRGAVMALHHPEIDGRTLDSVGLSLTWSAVPPGPHGFARHYAQYVIGPDRLPTRGLFDNRSFRVAFAGAVGDGDETFLFSPSGGGDPIAADGPVGRLSRFELKRSQGPVRLTLTAPDHAFGDDLHAVNLLNAVKPVPLVADDRLFTPTLYDDVRHPPGFWSSIGSPFKHWLNRRKPSTTVSQVDPTAPTPGDVTELYPNPPWRPEAASIRLDYAITLAAAPGGEAMFARLPTFGGLDPVAGSGDFTLLAPLDDGVLDVGLRHLRPRSCLSLLVQTAPCDLPLAADELTWQWDHGDGWSPLPPHQLVWDETDRLSETGRLVLTAPQRTAAAPGLTWLRATRRQPGAPRPRLTGLTLNALSVVREVHPGSDVRPVPPGGVTGPVAGLAGVAAIAQPLPSSGGRPAEADDDLSARMSERTRHRARAVEPWDYERLLLDGFPEIACVRVLPVRRGGEVTIVVVPRDDATVDAEAPRFAPGLRRRMAAWLSERAGGFVRIHVVDPVYVRIAVRAELVSNNADAGDAGARIEHALKRGLSPYQDFILPDRAGPSDVRARVLNLLLSQAGVSAVAKLDLSFSPDPDGLEWWTPTSAAGHRLTIVPGPVETGR